MSDPLVSFIIPTHNRAAMLPTTFASVFAQDYAAREIIVVDDGSTDNTAEVCAQYDVRYVRQENQGGCSARNNGVRHSKGELLVFLDDDDLCVEGSLRRRVDHWLKQPQTDVILGKLRRFVETEGGHFDFIDDEAGQQYLCLGASLVTRRAFERVGGFDEGFRMGACEDVELWMRMCESGAAHRFINDVCLLYRRHPGNATREREETERSFLNMIRLTMRRRRGERELHGT